MTYDLQLDAIAGDFGFPEGPVAMNDGTLLFVDIEGKKLVRINDQGECLLEIDLPGGPNGVAIGPDGAAYVCNNGGIYSFVHYPPGTDMFKVPFPDRSSYLGGRIQRVDLETKEVTDLYTSPADLSDPAPHGVHLLAPDDIVFDSQGGFWFTDSGFEDSYQPADAKKGTPERPAMHHYGALFYATIDGQSLTRIATVPMANGVGLSPDESKLYVSDTLAGRLWEMDIEAPGKVKARDDGAPGRLVLSLPPVAGRPQWLDSLKVEASGKVCIGTLFNGGVTVVDPADGSYEHVPVPSAYSDEKGTPIPELFVTNLCFGGEDMMDVWITASSAGRSSRGDGPGGG